MKNEGIEELVQGSLSRVGLSKKKDNSEATVNPDLRRAFTLLWSETVNRSAELREAANTLKLQMNSVLTELHAYGAKAVINDLGEVQGLGNTVDRLVGELKACRQIIKALEEAPHATNTSPPPKRTSH